MPQTVSVPSPHVEELLRMFVDQVKDYAILIMDPEGQILHVNTGVKRITGYGDEVIGRRLQEIFTPEDVQSRAPERELAAARQTGCATDERWHVRRDGSRFWALGVVAPIRSSDGNLLGFGKLLTDRTDLRQLHEALERQNAALSRVDEERKLFLAIVAHELRNPQAVLANSAALLRRFAPDNDQVLRVADVIDRQVRHTKRIVDDLADLARASHGKVHLNTTVLDLRAAARDAIEAVRPSAQERKLSLSIILSEAPVEIEADADRLQQILINLLTNAVRYTDEGGRIGLTVNMEDGDAVMRVSDNGVGIPPARLASIFELFSQAHTERRESQAGLGIGLALTRELVAAHGGTIQAHSDGAGRGSEFIVRFPSRCTRQPGAGPQA